MKLSELLHHPVVFEPPVMPALTKVQAAAKRVFERWPHIVALPSESDRDALVKDMERRRKAPVWPGTPMSLVTVAARALFDPVRRRHPGYVKLRQFYYDEAAVSTRTTFLDAMLEVYFESFEPYGEHTEKLAEALRRQPSRFGSRSLRRLESFPNCLYRSKAPAEIARRMVEMQDAWQELKPFVGAPHAPGLMQHAHLAFVAALAPRLRERATAEKLLAWLKPAGQRALVSGADKAIEAILAPWREVDPSEDLQTYLLNTLFDAYGDPRVRVGEVWAGVDEELKAIVYRWLTGKHIKFFLDVMSAVEKGGMWESRREFWEKLFKEKRITDATVALSPAAEKMARQLAQRNPELRHLTFSKQVAGGSRKDTSLLVMKIGEKIVVEGSHSYKVHIFPLKSKWKPQLKERYYDCERIRECLDDDDKHWHDPPGHWRSWVLERI